MCRAYFRLETSARLKLIEADAGSWVADAKNAASADVLCVDLYDHDAASPVLDTDEFYADCHRVLKAGGAMTVNLFGRDASFERSAQRIAAAFGVGCVLSLRPTREGNTIVIGALTKHYEVATSAEIKAAIPALAAMAHTIGDTQVRNRGTMGGSVANNDPSADYPAALLALGATIKTDRRTVSADDFFTGMFATALETGEIVTAIHIPVPSKAGYAKMKNPASRYSMAGVFVATGPAGVRVAVNGAGNNGVFRVAAMEQALTAKWAPESVAGIKLDPADMNGDIHGSAEYRAHLVTVMAKRAVVDAG
jgi:carbon-monoxide dehydrogenase medium subunit